LQIKTGAASPLLPPLLLLLMVLCLLDGARRCHFLRARALASTMGKKWLPLESNPEVMADFAHA